MEYDLLLKNGRLYNPKRRVNEVGDIAVSKGRIAALGTELGTAKKTVDCSGCLVTPGLIDCHMHLNYLGCASGMPVDLPTIPSGITAGIDAGSTGVSTAPALVNMLRECELKTKFMLNVSASGIIMANQFPENVDPSVWDIGMFDAIFSAYGDQIPALKVRISKKVVGGLGITPLVRTIQLAERYGVRVCVHTTDPPVDMGEIAGLLRPGDILAHVYQGAGNTCVEDGMVTKGLWRGKERGVLFDTSCGQGNLSLAVAKQAIEQGFLPDSISTDLNIYNWGHPMVFSLPAVMSKFLALGMTLEQVVDCVTEAPAVQWGAERELGCLLPGTTADISVLRLVERTMKFEDKYGNVLHGHMMIIPEMTVIDGRMRYQSMSLHP